MRVILNLLVLVLIASTAIGQGNDIIKISSERNENIIKIFAENTGDQAYNVILNINSTGFKHTKECPLEETIGPGEKMYMTSLIAKKDEAASYSVSMKYTPTHPKQGQRVGSIVSEKNNRDLSKGIFVFSKEGCGRCVHVEKFLNDHQIAFTKLNITKNAGDATLMWSELAKAGYDKQNVSTPVIVVDGEVHYDPTKHNDLLKELSTK